MKGEKRSPDAFPSEREASLQPHPKTMGPWNKQESEVEATSSSRDRKERPRREAEANPEEGLRGWGRASTAKPAGFESASQELVDILHFLQHGAQGEARGAHLAVVEWQQKVSMDTHLRLEPARDKRARCAEVSTRLGSFSRNPIILI